MNGQLYNNAVIFLEGPFLPHLVNRFSHFIFKIKKEHLIQHAWLAHIVQIRYWTFLKHISFTNFHFLTTNNNKTSIIQPVPIKETDNGKASKQMQHTWSFSLVYFSSYIQSHMLIHCALASFSPVSVSDIHSSLHGIPTWFVLALCP